MFRKDLSQTFAPLVVDPATLTAVVKTSIRIPENAFPTITRVPGSMINFRYYVEVVADLRGKLTSPERFLPRFNMVSGGRKYSPSGQILNPTDAGANSVSSNWAGNILDTDQIRREKGVIAVAFEVVVGTHDSDRGQQAEPGGELTQETGDWPEPTNADAEYGPYGPEAPEYGPDEQWPDEPPYESLEMVAPPEVEEPVDEKTQMRRAEETLLPSQPPEPGPSGEGDIEAPTAPVLPEDDLHDYQHMPCDGLQATSAESVQTVVPPRPSEPGEPDKQELERRRLMEHASAPAESHDGEGPSAPVLDDEDQLVGVTNGDESLPQYQR